MSPTVSPVAAQTFAFITHSPATLPNNLPPSVDNERLARRRRRRTSQHDQAILESEFAKNDRPDRVTREVIANKVGLTEKQVQIWFQNRRQTNRRKSRPLQPHEMIPHNSDRSLELSSDPFTSSPHNLKTVHDDDTIEIPSPSSRASSPCPGLEPMTKMDTRTEDPDHVMHIMSDATEPDMNTHFSTSSGAPLDRAEFPRKTSPIQFLLNPTVETENMSFQSTQSTIPDEPEISQFDNTMLKTTESTSFSQTFVNPRRTGLAVESQPKLLKRSSSLVRLSMSFDGKATVVLEDDTATPSMTNQNSALTESTSFHENLTTPPKRRTVDAKIWESCCDSQSSVPTEPVKQDTPRKTLKKIRARGVVAAAKAAADARKHQSTPHTEKKKKVLGEKSANGTTAPKPTKSAKPQRSSPTKKEKTRKVITATHKGPAKATPSPPLSAVKNMKRSPFRTLERTLSGRNDKPGFTIYQSSEDGDSEKENWDPQGCKTKRTSNVQPSFGRKNGRNILGDIAQERVPQPNELEVIENLMSLRDGLWR